MAHRLFDISSYVWKNLEEFSGSDLRVTDVSNITNEVVYQINVGLI